MQVLIDTGIILALLSRGEREFPELAGMFSLAERGRIQLFASSLSFARISDVLSHQKNHTEAKSILRRLQLIVKILDLDKKIINLYLSDDLFEDFDEGMNYYTALENEVEVIVTFGAGGYRRSGFPVMTPGQLLGLVRENDAF